MGNLDFSANADQLKELAAYMASQINVPTIGIGGGYAPIGSINFFDATTAPQDWLACDGTVYNIADYPQLADWYEAQHGSKNFYGGDGTTTFAVPDLQGEFLRGTGTNSHNEQGDGGTVGEHQDATGIPYIFQSANNIASFTNPSLPSDANDNHSPMNRDSFYEGTNSSTIHRVNQDQTAMSAGKAGYYSARPTNTSFLICVKAVVAGEVYSTEERVVGTWIDGKPVYQKTFTGTVSAYNNISYNPIGASIDTVVDIKGIHNNLNSIIGMTNDSLSTGVACLVLSNTEGTYANTYCVYCKPSGQTSLVGKPYILTIQYTKTTD